ncbi:MAG: putative rane protein [Bacteroidetes bacterium]|nr:putative rane protein [Bacteroidota bacterium]
MIEKRSFSKIQLFCLIALRVVIGWYFLYEGLSKFFTPGWTSYGYLMDSQGLFAGLFKSMGQNQALMPFIDAVNIYGLILIGLFLILGLFEKLGYIGAIALLTLYYLSHPASLNATYLLPPEGSYLWINKNIVMLCSVFVLMAFPTAKRIGFDRIIFKNKKA